MENQVKIVKQVNDREVMDSRDVAKMIGKRHTDLIRDIRRYISVLETDAKLRPSDFFVESSYLGGNGQDRVSFLLTKQGCEFGPAVNDAEDPVNKLGKLVNLGGRFLSAGTVNRVVSQDFRVFLDHEDARAGRTHDVIGIDTE